MPIKIFVGDSPNIKTAIIDLDSLKLGIYPIGNKRIEFPENSISLPRQGELVDLLDNIDKKSRETDIIEVITNSPLIIGSYPKEQVFIKNGVDWENPKIETFGASLGLIIEVVIGLGSTVAPKATRKLNSIRKIAAETKNFHECKVKMLDLGESVEKFDTYSFLRHLEKGD